MKSTPILLLYSKMTIRRTTAFYQKKKNQNREQPKSALKIKDWVNPHMFSFHSCNSIRTKENICSFINCFDSKFLNQRVEHREESLFFLVTMTANMKKFKER